MDRIAGGEEPPLPPPHSVNSVNSVPSSFPADPRTVIGAQGRLISRACAEFLLEKGRGPGLRQDLRFARLAAARFGAVWVHRPSLVQHRAAASTWGGPAHTAWDFDAEWRAE